MYCTRKNYHICKYIRTHCMEKYLMEPNISLWALTLIRQIVVGKEYHPTKKKLHKITKRELIRLLRHCRSLWVTSRLRTSLGPRNQVPQAAGGRVATIAGGNAKLSRL